MKRRSTMLMTLIYLTLGVAAVLTFLPFLWMFTSSFRTNAGFFDTYFLPATVDEDGVSHVALGQLTLEHYRKLFFDLGFGRAILNSVFLSSVTSVIATLLASMAGYALARFDFRGRSFALMVVLVMLIVPAPLLLAPTYQLVFDLGLLDTYSALILPAAAPAFGVFLFRQATLSSVPSQLLEAARIDGCGEFRIFFTMALPLLRPMIGAFLLITFLWSWNNFIGPQVMLQDVERFPLAVAVGNLKGLYYQDYGLQMAGTLVSILPVMVLFLLLQRDFIAGLTAGAVKG
ncbi:MAG: carbohydrate ABC transporter permease [Phycisphaerales bacterium]|nr:carbohydrate ABC transporter permease [Phycisphaerales bacterium]